MIVVPTLTRPDVPLRVVSVAAVPTIFPTVILGVPERPKEVVAKETDEIPVRFAPLPTKDVAVTIPDALRLVAPIVPTVILGVPDKPKEVVAKEAVDAVPVRAPIKEVAVTIPAKLAPVLTFPTSCTLVTDILFLFSYLY